MFNVKYLNIYTCDILNSHKLNLFQKNPVNSG